MPVEIRLYGVFKDIVDEKRLRREIAPRDNIRDLIDDLVEEFPELGAHVLTADGGLDETVNITINGRAIGFLDGATTRLEEGDLVRFAHSVSGG